MGDYRISATKYRPKSFKEVVGQDAVTRTLENAITQKKLGQALLFCGPRGVGKTTCARILARTINFSQGEKLDYSFNIFELDAASNRSVDDIRNLNEQVRVPPRIGNFKIYIIDEAHMLTTEAFNAFLKTLEEPPKHVVFILATTEKSKILPTVLSRCQIYDFKRISVTDIKMKLENILLDQNIQYEDEALFLIAESGDGSLRDGLQMLDKMINFCENNINTESVSKILNIIDNKIYLEICDELIDQNTSEALICLDKVISNGFNELDFIIGLSNHFRNLFLSKNESTLKLIETSKTLEKIYLDQSKKIDLDFIKEALKILNTFEINFNKVDSKRIHTEICLIQISSIRKEISNKKKKITTEPDDTQIVEKDRQITNNKITKSFGEDIDKKNENYKIKTEDNQATELNLNIDEISSFSLASVEKKRKYKNDKLIDTKLEKKAKGFENDFTQEDLVRQWNNYYNLKIKNKEFNIASLLKISIPKKSENKILYSVVSDINKKELNIEIPKLLEYIRKSLKNDFIEIQIDSNISPKKNIIYTPSEKFEKLVELNPSLQILKNKLDLDY